MKIDIQTNQKMWHQNLLDKVRYPDKETNAQKKESNSNKFKDPNWGSDKLT